jgi:hypothetical protein
MEMKPEYHHGIHREQYHLYLRSDKVGNKPLAVKAVLAKYVKKFAEYSDDIFLQLCNRPNSRVFSHVYYGHFVEEFRLLLTELENAGAQPLIIDQSEHYLFPRRALYQLAIDEWLNTYKRWQRDPYFRDKLHQEEEFEEKPNIQQHSIDSENSRLSRNLIQIEEYALDLWAKENDIQQAYRAFIQVDRAISRSDVIRIWQKDGSVDGLIKYSEAGLDLSVPVETPPLPPITYNIESRLVALSNEQWTAIEQFMDNEFWMAKSWYSLTDGSSILDGYHIVVDGWKDGQYKVLYDVWSGNALYAYNLLAQIVGHRQIGIR